MRWGKVRLSPFLRESALFSGSTGLEQGSRLLSNLAVAGILGPTIWGAWYLLNLVLRYGSLVHLGSTNGMNRELPAALGRGSELEATRVQRSSLGFVVASMTVAGVVILLGNSLLPQPFQLRHLLPTVLLLAFHQLHGFGITALRARTRFVAISKVQAVSALLFPALCIPGALLGGLTGFLMGQVATYLVLTAMIGLSQPGLFRMEFDWPESLRLIRIGFPIMMVGVTHTFFSTIDRWIVVASMGNTALGHYSMAILALNTVQLVPRVFAQQIYPRMAFDWAKHQDPGQLLMHGRRQARLAFGAAAFIALPAAIIAPWAIRTFLPDYTPGIGALLVSLVVPAVTVIGQGFGNILNIINRQRIYLTVIVVGTAVSGGVSLLLVEPLGLLGVALGTLAGYLAIGIGLVLFGPPALRRVASSLPAAPNDDTEPAPGSALESGDKTTAV